MSAFKAYDIRGIYNKDFDKNDVYRIGYYLPQLLKADRVLVGRDARLSSDEVFDSLSAGINDGGADVVDIGLSTTPMVYFATAFYHFDASVQITASHNPPEYNGLKVSKTDALPVGYYSGLSELEKMIQTKPPTSGIQTGKKIIKKNIKDDYIGYLNKYVPDIRNLRVGIDCSNGMSVLLIKDLLGEAPTYLYDTIDGSFPNHEPNPLVEENVEDLKRLVKSESLDLGVIFDGDADRVMFVDDRGLFISPDLMIAVLGIHYLRHEKGYVLHDIRTSKSVSEYITKLGGTPYMWKVGHAFAKLKMRELKAIFGGELAGHYYFRDFFNCDSGILASLLILEAAAELKKQGKTISDLIGEIVTYAYSGEINFKIEDKIGVMRLLKDHYSKNETVTAFYDFDGYRIEFPRWWFNVRPSNTEPYLRLVIEAEDRELLNQKLTEIKALLSQ